MPRFPSAERIIRAAINYSKSSGGTVSRGAGAARAGTRFSRGSRLLRAGGWGASKPYVMLPMLGVTGIVGGSIGFSDQVLNSQTGQDFLQLYAPPTSPNPTAIPLGYSEYDNPYIYRTPPGGGIGATGELALALFKTRHGR